MSKPLFLNPSPPPHFSLSLPVAANGTRHLSSCLSPQTWGSHALVVSSGLLSQASLPLPTPLESHFTLQALLEGTLRPYISRGLNNPHLSPSSFIPQTFTEHPLGIVLGARESVRARQTESLLSWGLYLRGGEDV